MNNTSLMKLASVFLHMKTKEEMYEFLLGILTPKEQKEIAKRLAIVVMLKQGVTQHDIAEKLGVGIATVTRGSKELQMGRFENI